MIALFPDKYSISHGHNTASATQLLLLFIPQSFHGFASHVKQLSSSCKPAHISRQSISTIQLPSQLWFNSGYSHSFGSAISTVSS